MECLSHIARAFRKPSFFNIPTRSVGSFELYYAPPPRYFYVSYEFRDGALDDAEEEWTEERSHSLQAKMAEGRVLVSGEQADGAGSFVIMQGADEREPHSFVMRDPFYVNGLVKNWSITELDLLGKERENELTVYSRYR